MSRTAPKVETEKVEEKTMDQIPYRILYSFHKRLTILSSQRSEDRNFILLF